MGCPVISTLGWQLHRTAPGAVRWAGDMAWDGTTQPVPSQEAQGNHSLIAQVRAVADLTSLKATVPGTVADVLLRDEKLNHQSDLLENLDEFDWWWGTWVTIPDASETDELTAWRLRLQSIATVSEVFWDGQRVAHSVSGLDDVLAQLPHQPGEHELAIVCRALSLVPVPRKPRPRWRSTLVADSSVRWRRTPLIGRIPWAGTYPVVGPWGEVSLEPIAQHGVQVHSVRTELKTTVQNPVGVVHVVVQAQHPVTIALSCAGQQAEHVLNPGQQRLSFEIVNPDLWWPGTHGTPALHEFTVTVHPGVDSQGQKQTCIFRRDVGFRTVEAITDNGGFALVVNGRKIFARGAVWAPINPVTLSADAQEIDRTVRAMRAAGANIVRISGTHSWESEAFYTACDRHGLLVWHDAMLATLDPPSDPAWLALVEAELRTWLPRLGAHPCLAVFSGGNEVLQQPVLWGRNIHEITIPVIEDTIPSLCHQLIPQAVYVPSSPSGGNPPTRVDTGISHWFGVGAYRRPFSDARTSNLRFAAEALAFGVPPAASQIAAAFGSDTAEHSDAARRQWKTAVACDPGADWDFEQTTIHYAKRWLEPGIEADTGAAGADLHNSDPVSWEALSREEQLQAERLIAGQAVERTMTDLRRNASGCDGVVILSSRDLVLGAGWGLLDATGRPKSTWYAMRRACADFSVRIIDEGLSGLHIHVFHDAPGSFRGMMHVKTWTRNNVAGPEVKIQVDLDEPGEKIWNIEDLLGGFLDLDHAWGFGQRQWEAVSVQVVPEHDGAGVHSLQDVRLLGGGHRDAVADLRQGLALSQQGSHQGVLRLDVGESTASAAAGVSVDVGTQWIPDDDVMVFSPGQRRVLTVVPADTWPAEAATSKRGRND